MQRSAMQGGGMESKAEAFDPKLTLCRPTLFVGRLFEFSEKNECKKMHKCNK
jgi:hypothetical protein